MKRKGKQQRLPTTHISAQQWVSECPSFVSSKQNWWYSWSCFNQLSVSKSLTMMFFEDLSFVDDFFLFVLWQNEKIIIVQWEGQHAFVVYRRRCARVAFFPFLLRFATTFTAHQRRRTIYTTVHSLEKEALQLLRDHVEDTMIFTSLWTLPIVS